MSLRESPTQTPPHSSAPVPPSPPLGGASPMCAWTTSAATWWSCSRSAPTQPCSRPSATSRPCSPSCRRCTDRWAYRPPSPTAEHASNETPNGLGGLLPQSTINCSGWVNHILHKGLFNGDFSIFTSLFPKMLKLSPNQVRFFQLEHWRAVVAIQFYKYNEVYCVCEVLWKMRHCWLHWFQTLFKAYKVIIKSCITWYDQHGC